MLPLELDYWNKLASQVILISALLGGFSLTVIVMLIENDRTGKLMNSIFRLAVISTAAFLVAIFAFTKLMMLSTPGYPLEISEGAIMFPRIVGFVCFVLGIASVIGLLAQSGRTKSEGLGRFSYGVAIVTFALVLLMLI